MPDVSLLFNLMARDSTGPGLNSAANGFKSTFGKVSKVVALGMGGAAVAMLGFAKDAAESAKVTRMVEQVVKSTGGVAGVSAAQVDKLATSISNKTGADDEAIASGEALLLTFTNVKNGVGKGNDVFNQATAAAVDMAAAMNGGEVTADGLKSANIQLGKALNDPIKGISALSKVGVSFTEQQKEQIKAMVKAGDTAGAQKLILAELGKEFGGQAAAATDPMVKLQTVLGNLGETLGAIVLPYVEQFSAKMAEVANWIGNNEGKVRVLGTVLGIIGTTILAINVALKVHTAVLTLTSGAWRLLATVMWANPVFIIAGIILAIGAALVVAYMKCETFRNVVNTAFGAVKTFVVSAFQVLSNTILGFWGMVIHGAAKAFGWVPGIGDKLKAADAEFTKFRDSVNAKLNAIKGPKPIHIAVTDDTAAAVARVRNLKAQVEGGGWSIAIKTSGPPAGIGVRLPARASGGPVTAGGTYLVGEKGPEVVTFGRSGYVHANDGGSGVAAPRGGGGTVQVELFSRDPLINELLKALRKEIRIGGGVAATLGRL